MFSLRLPPLLHSLLLLLLPAPASSLALVRPPKRVAVVGGGFAGLTAARNLASHAGVEVLLCDQRCTGRPSNLYPDPDPDH